MCDGQKVSAMIVTRVHLIKHNQTTMAEAMAFIITISPDQQVQTRQMREALCSRAYIYRALQNIDYDHALGSKAGTFIAGIQKRKCPEVLVFSWFGIGMQSGPMPS